MTSSASYATATWLTYISHAAYTTAKKTMSCPRMKKNRAGFPPIPGTNASIPIRIVAKTNNATATNNNRTA